MNKKIIVCVHDKKSDIYEGFMAYNNTNEALRGFQMTCEQNETFKKWPEDFRLMLVCEIGYQNGTIKENGEIENEAKFVGIKNYFTPLAEALDFVTKKEKKHAETPAED